MTIAITSDIHLGDDGCKLVRGHETTPAYAAFRQCIRAAAGGWLGEAGKSAEVFFIDRDGTLRSVNIP